MKASDIETLHKLYCQLTGKSLSLHPDRVRAWYEFVKAGFTAEDLRLVLLHLKRGERHGYRHRGSYGFTRLVWRLDVFEEELIEARAHCRNSRPRSDRERVVEALRPAAVEEIRPVRAKPAKEVILRLVEELRRAVQ